MNWTRFHTIIGLFGLFLAIFSTAQAQRGSGPITISYVAVEENPDDLRLNVFFTMRDPNSGEPIPSPSISEGTIELLGLGGEPVGVNIEKPNTPIYIVLLIDGSGSMQQVMPQVREAAKTAIDQAPSNAHFSVIQFDEEINVVQGFTDNHERVKLAIDGVVSRANRGTCLYDATFDAIGRVTDQTRSPAEQQAIILFTDGRDQLTVDNPAPCSTQTLDTVIQAARPRDITQPSTPIHTIGLYDGANRSNIDEFSLTRLANETLAFSAFGNSSQLDDLFGRIMDGLNSQLVATASVFAQQGQNRAILSIRSNRDGPAQDAPFTFTANLPHDAPPDPVSAIPRPVSIDDEKVRFPLGINNSQQVARLAVDVVDEGNVLVLSDSDAAVFVPPPAPSVVIEMDVAAFEPGETYNIIVVALNEDGGVIPNLEGDNFLIQQEFTSPEAEPLEFEYQIDSVTVDYDAKTMKISLDIDEPDKVFAYAGFINDSDGTSEIAEFSEASFTDEYKLTKEMVLELPDAIANTTEEREYELTLILKVFDDVTREEREFRETREFSPTPPDPLSRIERLIEALRENPYILYMIIGVLLGMILLVMQRNRRAKKKIVPVVRPPVENKTMLFGDPLFRNMHGRGDEEGFDSVAAPVDRDITAVPSGREGNSPYKAKLVVLRMPKEQVLESRVFNMFPLTVGREGDIVVREDPYISRKHVEIGVNNDSFYALDLDSKGGVRINGVQIAPGQKVPIDRKTRLQLSSKTTVEVTVAQ